jgi:hypothetical protein
MYDNKCVYCGKELQDKFYIDHLLSVLRAIVKNTIKRPWGLYG